MREVINSLDDVMADVQEVRAMLIERGENSIAARLMEIKDDIDNIIIDIEDTL